jgi:hypothetical protein
VCAIGGDAAELVKLVNKCAFPVAVKFLADLVGVIPSRLALTPAPARPSERPPEQPSGLPVDEASDLVEEARRTLWGPGGEKARAYLHGRGLTDETVRAAGLGFTPHVMVPTKEGDRCFPFSGITIPWRDGPKLTRLKIRRIDDGKPRYAEAYRNRPRIFPDPANIKIGLALLLLEGEFDALLLGQEIPEASAITLGSASARTDPAVLSMMLRAPRWFIALDADQAGDSASAKFPARAIRVRPPAPFKDWTDTWKGGVNLGQWWRDRLTETKEETETVSSPPGPPSEPVSPQPADDDPLSVARSLITEGYSADEVNRALAEYLNLVSGPDPSPTDFAVIELCKNWPDGDPASWAKTLEWVPYWNKVVLARKTRLAEAPDKGTFWLLEASFPEVPQRAVARPPKDSRTAPQDESPTLPFNEDPSGCLQSSDE